MYGEVKFWSLPLKWLVTLTTVLRYRAACDTAFAVSSQRSATLHYHRYEAN